MPNQKGFAHILIVVIVVVIAAIGLAVLNPFGKRSETPSIIKNLIGNKGPGSNRFSNLPNCKDKQFTVPLVDINEIESISPLGNLNPPEHTTPTSHLYINLNSTGVKLVAPGDITITNISSGKNNELGTTDYSIDFALCEDVFGYFIHIKTLSPELESLLTGENCETYGKGGKYINCWTDVNKKLKAGETIGTVSNNIQRNFDFGAYDFRTKLNYANPERYSPGGDSKTKGLSLVCALDYYSQPQKQLLYNKLDRKLEPLCGTVAQDIPGTLQGNWFFEDADIASPSAWDKHLTFGHDSNNPNIATISIGGVFTNFGTYSFLAKTEGLINREFSEVKPDGNIYCFEAADGVLSESPRTDGKILVKLTDTNTLQIEQKTGSCDTKEGLTNPTIYNR